MKKVLLLESKTVDAEKIIKNLNEYEHARCFEFCFLPGTVKDAGKFSGYVFYDDSILERIRESEQVIGILMNPLLTKKDMELQTGYPEPELARKISAAFPEKVYLLSSSTMPWFYGQSEVIMGENVRFITKMPL